MKDLKPNPLRLAESRILIEQLRLIYSGMTVSLWAVFPATFLLVWVLVNQVNRVGLFIWFVAISLSNSCLIFHARSSLAARLTEHDSPVLVRRLVVFVATVGLAWGGLALGVLGNIDLVGNILVTGVLAGILGGFMSLLSPVLLVFVAFSVPLVGLTAVKLWQLNEPAYGVLGVVALVYFGILITNARNSSQAARASIELRFENLDLLHQADAARAEAEKANTAKSKFLAAASHDLRQPIHAQGLFLDVLVRTKLNMQQRELVTRIGAAGGASVAMLNTLLDFSRIEAGAVRPNSRPFRLQQVLNKIEREFEPQADSKRLAYRSRETFLVVHSDPTLLDLILRNLVSNAIRYTSQGGLLVCCRKRGKTVLLEVWDTGVGIDHKSQGEIFRAFHQLGDRDGDKRQGLGLGLSIVRGLCKILGHELTLRSRPQCGSVFRLVLPLAQVMPITMLDTPGDTWLHNDTLMLGVHVLVIDHDDVVLHGMALLLESWGCEVDTAHSIERALVLAQLQAPAILVTDYHLARDRTGAHAIAQIRKLLGTQVPAVMITGDTGPECLQAALQVNVPLLHKPLAPRDLYVEMIQLIC